MSASDLQGLAQLGVDGVLGVTRTVEHMHHSIVSRLPFGPPRSGERTRGLTGLIYQSVRGTTRLSGWSLQAITRALGHAAIPTRISPRREAVVSALCGVWGDHMAATHNPLAIAMALRVQGRPLTLERNALAERLPQASPRVLVMVHGLCMNDLQWTRQGHDHGAALAQELGYTPVYLHYNTGLPVANNGQALSDLLAALVEQWPVPVQEISIVGHSMGGLVSRSACNAAAQGKQSWLGLLRTLVCMGTPHHGAPLERGGRLLDSVLGSTPYLAPFARLGRARSAGIADLRYGNVREVTSPRGESADNRPATPLPLHVDTFLMAAVQAERADAAHPSWWGDGLVPLASALGQHPRPELDLQVPASRQWVLRGANHWDLLSHPLAYQHLVTLFQR